MAHPGAVLDGAIQHQLKVGQVWKLYHELESLDLELLTLDSSNADYMLRKEEIIASLDVLWKQKCEITGGSIVVSPPTPPTAAVNIPGLALLAHAQVVDAIPASSPIVVESFEKQQGVIATGTSAEDAIWVDEDDAPFPGDLLLGDIERELEDVKTIAADRMDIDTCQGQNANSVPAAEDMQLIKKVNEHLEKKIARLEQHIHIARPLVEIGAAIRKRFLIHELGHRRSGYQDCVSAGNVAAHEANVLADSALYNLGYLQNLDDGFRKTWMELYPCWGDLPGSLWADKIWNDKVGHCISMVATCRSQGVITSARWDKLKAMLTKRCLELGCWETDRETQEKVNVDPIVEAVLKEMRRMFAEYTSGGRGDRERRIIDMKKRKRTRT